MFMAHNFWVTPNHTNILGPQKGWWWWWWWRWWWWEVGTWIAQQPRGDRIQVVRKLHFIIGWGVAKP